MRERLAGKPDAGNPPVRFDGGRESGGHWARSPLNPPTPAYPTMKSVKKAGGVGGFLLGTFCEVGSWKMASKNRLNERGVEKPVCDDLAKTCGCLQERDIFLKGECDNFGVVKVGRVFERGLQLQRLYD